MRQCRANNLALVIDLTFSLTLDEFIFYADSLGISDRWADKWHASATLSCILTRDKLSVGLANNSRAEEAASWGIGNDVLFEAKQADS